MADYIMTMHKVGKFIPPDRDLIKDITLSFIYGAKIVVLGPNGAGKSTLLKIMAGIDPDFNGELRITPGYSVGMLMQEPELDNELNVYDNILAGIGDVADLLKAITNRVKCEVPRDDHNTEQPQGNPWPAILPGGLFSFLKCRFEGTLGLHVFLVECA